MLLQITLDFSPQASPSSTASWFAAAGSILAATVAAVLGLRAARQDRSMRRRDREEPSLRTLIEFVGDVRVHLDDADLLEDHVGGDQTDEQHEEELQSRMEVLDTSYRRLTERYARLPPLLRATVDAEAAEPLVTSLARADTAMRSYLHERSRAWLVAAGEEPGEKMPSSTEVARLLAAYEQAERELLTAVQNRFKA